MIYITAFSIANMIGNLMNTILKKTVLCLVEPFKDLRIHIFQ